MGLCILYSAIAMSYSYETPQEYFFPGSVHSCCMWTSSPRIKGGPWLPRCVCFSHSVVSDSGFPGGSVVNDLPANAGDAGDERLIPELERSHR